MQDINVVDAVMGLFFFIAGNMLARIGYNGVAYKRSKKIKIKPLNTCIIITPCGTLLLASTDTWVSINRSVCGCNHKPVTIWYLELDYLHWQPRQLPDTQLIIQECCVKQFQFSRFLYQYIGGPGSGQISHNGLMMSGTAT